MTEFPEPMDDVDQTIRNALSLEDAQWFDEQDEQSVHEMLVGVFQGKSRWLAAIGLVSTLLFLVLAIVAVSRFFVATTTREMIAWATGFVICGLAISLFKIWCWLQISQNSVTREIKRFELQLARLSGRIDR